MTTSLKATLDQALRAYAVVDQKSISPPTRNPLTGVGEYLPEKDRLFVHQYTELIEQGLWAARKGDLTNADKWLCSARSLLYNTDLSHEGFLLFKVAYETSTAYLDYCHSDFDTAVSRLNEALLIDEQLEKKKNEYALLHLHRIQILLNDVQLNARRNHIKEAMDMSFHILNYLERKTKTIPTVTSWDSTQLVFLPQQIVADLFVGTTYKIASMVAGRKTILVEGQDLDVRDLFAGAQTHIQVGDTGSCHLSPPAHAWLRAKQAFVDNDGADFLSKAADILAEGQGDAPFFWYATLVDLFAFCRQWDLPEASTVKRMIENAPWQIWRFLPKTWKQILGSGSSRLFP